MQITRGVTTKPNMFENTAPLFDVELN